MIRHPFNLKISELETINLEIKKVTDEEAKKVTGGLRGSTTAATCEEGGENPTTAATGEEGGDLTIF